MKLKSIHMAPDRYDRLKAMSKERSFRSVAQFVEKLVVEADAQNSQTIGALTPEGIEAEVTRRVEESLAALPSTSPVLPPPLVITDNRDLTPLVGHMSPHSLEDCARSLLNMLPESTKAFAYEVCDHLLHIQPSQLIHGHLMNAADGGTLQAPHMDASWEIRKEQMDSKQSVCEWHECKQLFKPERWGQRFCSNICGGKNATAELPKPAPKTQPILDAPGMQSLIAV